MTSGIPTPPPAKKNSQKCAEPPSASLFNTTDLGFLHGLEGAAVLHAKIGELALDLVAFAAEGGNVRLERCDFLLLGPLQRRQVALGVVHLSSRGGAGVGME